MHDIKRNEVNNVMYPLDVEDFIRIQQDGIGRKLDEGEQQLASMSVDLINLAYEAGKNGSAQVFTLNDDVSFFSKREKLDALKQPAVARVFLSLLYWTKNAYCAGEAARCELV